MAVRQFVEQVEPESALKKRKSGKKMEIGIFANESDDNFLGSRDLDNEYESEYLVRFKSEKVRLHLERP